MATITFIQRDGSPRVIAVPNGETAMRAAFDAGIRGINGDCGGSLACATCHVYVESGPVDALPPLEAAEDELLDGVASPRLANSRLSCQIVAAETLDGLVLRVPERQM